MLSDNQKYVIIADGVQWLSAPCGAQWPWSLFLSAASWNTARKGVQCVRSLFAQIRNRKACVRTCSNPSDGWHQHIPATGWLLEDKPPCRAIIPRAIVFLPQGFSNIAFDKSKWTLSVGVLALAKDHSNNDNEIPLDVATGLPATKKLFKSCENLSSTTILHCDTVWRRREDIALQPRTAPLELMLEQELFATSGAQAAVLVAPIVPTGIPKWPMP